MSALNGEVKEALSVDRLSVTMAKAYGSKKLLYLDRKLVPLHGVLIALGCLETGLRSRGLFVQASVVDKTWKVCCSIKAMPFSKMLPCNELAAITVVDIIGVLHLPNTVCICSRCDENIETFFLQYQHI